MRLFARRYRLTSAHIKPGDGAAIRTIFLDPHLARCLLPTCPPQGICQSRLHRKGEVRIWIVAIMHKGVSDKLCTGIASNSGKASCNCHISPLRPAPIFWRDPAISHHRTAAPQFARYKGAGIIGDKTNRGKAG